MSSDIRRQLGIGQGTLADKERDYQTRSEPKPVEAKVKIERVAGIWLIMEGGSYRFATPEEIKQHAPVTILDNDDD